MDRIQQYLTYKEAAEYLGYSTGYFRRLVRNYDIPSYGPGNNRFRKMELDKWMENKDIFTETNRPRRPRKLVKAMEAIL